MPGCYGLLSLTIKLPWSELTPPDQGAFSRGLMRKPRTELRLQVRDDEIIVIRPGSFYSVSYVKPNRSPQLMARRIPKGDDIRIAMTRSDFLDQAWTLANHKAKELGWI